MSVRVIRLTDEQYEDLLMVLDSSPNTPLLDALLAHDVEWDDSDFDDEPDIDEQYEIESSLVSAGWGTDEDYGYYGDEY